MAAGIDIKTAFWRCLNVCVLIHRLLLICLVTCFHVDSISFFHLILYVSLFSLFFTSARYFFIFTSPSLLTQASSFSLFLSFIFFCLNAQAEMPCELAGPPEVRATRFLFHDAQRGPPPAAAAAAGSGSNKGHRDQRQRFRRRLLDHDRSNATTKRSSSRGFSTWQQQLQLQPQQPQRQRRRRLSKGSSSSSDSSSSSVGGGGSVYRGDDPLMLWQSGVDALGNALLG